MVFDASMGDVWHPIPTGLYRAQTWGGAGGACEDADGDLYFASPFCGTLADCAQDATCQAPPAEAEICDDGIDNDADGKADCFDRDCAKTAFCK